MRKIVLALLTGFFGILLICVIRAFLVVPAVEESAAPPSVRLTSDMLHRLSAVIQRVTVFDEDAVLAEEFLALRDYLETSLPNIHRLLERQIISNYSLLYRWEGQDPSLDADLFVTHMDVVPVGEEDIGRWTARPFGGEILEGYLWGRGTLDNKGPLMALLEAIERRVSEGYRPRRTIYVSVGHDEETGGLRGAQAISRLLRLSGIGLRSVFDEGGFITEGLIPYTSRPIAVVGVVEKGYLTLELSVQGKGGHSAAPQGLSAIARLGQAVAKIESNRLPPRLPPVVEQSIENLAPELTFLPRMVAANLWIFRPLVRTWFSRSSLFPLVRTTSATTLFHAGQKENVLPAQASALVNFRLLPGDSRESVLQHVRKVVSDPLVEIGVHSTRGVESYFPPAPEADYSTAVYRAIRKTLSEIVPGAIAIPSLNVGATDSRHFLPMTKQVFRFVPLRVSRDDLGRLHGIDERIALSNYQECIQYYYRLLENLDHIN